MPDMPLRERVGRKLMEARAAPPGYADVPNADRWPILDADPDYDDLPRHAGEGVKDEDPITQEGVLALADAAIAAMDESGEYVRVFPLPVLRDLKPLVLYFDTDQDRQEFADLVKAYCPTWWDIKSHE